MRSKIAIVDDNVASLTIARTIIAAHHDCIPLPGGLQLLAMLEKIQPALILLDIEMPGMSGYETYRALREKGCRAPVIFLSGNEGAEAKAEALFLGAADYIVKPFDPESLIRTINKHIA